MYVSIVVTFHVAFRKTTEGGSEKLGQREAYSESYHKSVRYVSLHKELLELIRLLHIRGDERSQSFQTLSPGV